MSPETPKTPDAWIFGIAGFAIGLLAASAWYFEGKLPEVKTASLPPAATTTQAAATSTAANSSTGLVNVSDQGAGNSVVVDSISASTKGLWVAVLETNQGNLGNVLGAAYINAPTGQVIVHLLRPTLPGRTYAVMLYRDNGDRVFSLASDSVYVDFSTGTRVVALFNTY